MNAVVNQLNTLKILLRPLRQISRLVSLEILSNCIKLISIDENELYCCRLTIYSTYFKSYDYSKKIRMIIDIDPLIKLLNMAGNSEYLRIRTFTNFIRFSYRDKGWTKILNIKRENVPEELQNIKCNLPEPAISLNLPLVIFRSIIKNVSSLADEFTWEIQKGKIVTKAKQLSYSYELKTTGKDSVSSKGSIRAVMPARYLKIIPLTQSSTEYIIIKFFRKGLASFTISEPNKYKIEFQISCNLSS